MESVTKVPQAARQAAETISCAIVFRTVGFYTEFHNVIAAALDQFPVVGDHENGSAAPRFAFQPFRDQAHILPIKAAGGLIKNQYPAAGKDGAGNGKALLLTAGQSGRVRAPVLVKAKFFQQISGTAFAFFRQFGIQQQLLRHACRKKLC